MVRGPVIVGMVLATTLAATSTAAAAPLDRLNARYETA